MPQVDFHILRESSPAARLKLACRLAEGAWRAGASVLVRFDADADLAEFDTLLWTTGDGSFVPHDRLVAGAASEQEAPITLTAGPLPATLSSWPVLIDLALEQPTAAQPPVAAPDRVIEIVDADERRRRAGRERFRAWRDAGVTPNTINHD